MRTGPSLVQRRPSTAPTATNTSAPAEGGEGLHLRAGVARRADEKHFAPHGDTVARHRHGFVAMRTNRLGPLVVPDAFAHEPGLSTLCSLGLSVLLPLQMEGGAQQNEGAEGLAVLGILVQGLGPLVLGLL